MKKIAFFLLILILMVSLKCRKVDEQGPIAVEVALGTESPSAQIIAQDMVFNYFLSNDKGEITTSFAEGENFYFNFSIRNGRKEYLYIINDFLENKSLFSIQTGKTPDLKPFIYSGKIKVGSGAHKLVPDQEYSFKVPWSDTRDSLESLHCYFINNHYGPLPKGKYKTSFTQVFCFDRPNSLGSFCTDSLTFIINLEIK
jgi:hypothetical protein